MNIPRWEFFKIQRVWNGDVETGKNPLFPHFWGIFKIFGGGKWTPDHKSRKKYSVDILPPHQSKQICLEEVFPSFSIWEIASFSQNSKYGENVEVQSHQFHIYIEIYWSIKFWTQQFLCVYNHKSCFLLIWIFFMIPNIFSSTTGKRWPFD